LPNVFETIEAGATPLDSKPLPQRAAFPPASNPFALIESQSTKAPGKNPFEELEAGTPVRAPMYGFDDKPISDEDYAAMEDRPGSSQSASPFGRVFSEGRRMATEALQPNVPLGPSDETLEPFSGIPFAKPFLKAQLTGADALLRGFSAPFHGAAGVMGQTANELGLAPGGTRAARDILGMMDVAGLMAPTGLGTAGPRVRATQRTPDASSVVPTAQPIRSASPAPQTLETPTASGTIPDSMPSNINLARIQAPEDVKAVISDMAQQQGGFAEARRGRVTFSEIRGLAPLVGMTAEKLAKRGVGKTLGSAEEMFAARQLLVSQADEVRRLARAAQGGSDADKMAALEAVTRMVAIQEQVAGATAEAGRMLSQFRMMADAKRSADDIRRILDSTGGRVEDLLEGIAKLDNAPPEAIASFVKKGWAARTSDQLLEAWINALLSGPVTHTTNMVSNALVAAWSIPETLASATVSKLTGSGISYREALGRGFGFLEGAKDGIRAGWRAFLSEEPSDFASKIEAKRYRSIPSMTFRKGKERKEIGGVPIPLTGEIQVGGRQVRLPGRLLTAEDEFFKAIGYRQELNAQALRTALKEGLKGKALAQRVAELKTNPSEELAKAARNAAERQTFTNPLGDVGRSLQSIAHRAPAVRVVMPFIRTPINIVKYAAQRSPFAPLFKEVRENLAGANGAAARDEQIARIALGSTVGAVTAYMAADGTITGAGPVDSKQRSLRYMTGWQPYSVKVGDSYYSYGRLEPLGMLLGVSADFAELKDAMTKEEEASIAALIMGSISKNLVSKTWLRGPAELIEAVQDPDRYGAQYVQNLLGTVVPTGVAQIARTRDPYLREARSILDTIRSRIPGQREKLPMRRDLFGEPIKLEGALGPDMVSPVYQSRVTNDPVATEMLRLGVSPSRVMRKISGVELEPLEFESYQVSTGQLARNLLSKVIASPDWAELPDDAKRDLIDDVMRKSRDWGRGVTMQQNPDLLLRIAAERAGTR
jgi:hypothetical protein